MKANFQNSYQKLPSNFYSQVNPRKVSNPKLIVWNAPLADFLGLEATSDEELAQIFSGNVVPDGAIPIATVYAGHQFAHFVPQLGDGRAILLGELRAKNAQLYDLQLKGPGPTPYSRNGDGLAALGPVLREYVVSEFMNRMKIPSTRALAVCTTGESVFREEELPGAVLTRVATSHVRVGTFQYFYAQKDRPGLEALLNFCVDRHYPHLERGDDLALRFLSEVLARQAELIADWMAVGFIHGVMNTDNSSVAGITIDYGPCAFMDTYNPNQVYSFIDRNGRYSYANQPQIAHWNLVRLAECLAPLCQGTEEVVVEKVNQRLAPFTELFQKYWCEKMGQKLGLPGPNIEDRALIESWLSYVQSAELDFTLSFRLLFELQNSDSHPYFPARPEREVFLKLWRQRVKSAVKLRAQLESVNPIRIPRNHIIESVIRSASNGDFSMFHELLAALEDPYSDDPKFRVFENPPEKHEIVCNTFCGT